MANFLDSFEKKEEQGSTPQRSSSGVKVTEHQVVIDKSYGRKKFTRLAIIGGVAAALCIIGILAVGAINRVTVQNFEKKTLAEAKVWATKNSIQVDAQYEYNKDIIADTIITQSVKSGIKISKGDTLQFIVSSGANPDEKITVPEFSTMTAAQIQAWIDENKMLNTKISEENSDTVASGGFIKAVYRDVTSGKDNFKRKDYLTITVSKGPTVAAGDVTMTDLVGKTKTEAESWASTNGITLVTTTETSETVAADKVISQDVTTGNIVKSGGTVNLVISGGTGVKVPSYSQVAMSEAQNTYPDFVVTVKQRYSSSAGYGKFISQSVDAGTRVVAADNKITVTYSLGKPYLENLAGSSEKDLASYFNNFVQKGANISYTVSYANSAVAKGTIISTSKYCEFLSMNETINIVISNGSETTQGTSGQTSNPASAPSNNEIESTTQGTSNHMNNTAPAPSNNETVPTTQG